MRSIRSRRQRRKFNKGFELQLTSMMDALVIIVVFLLKNYNVSENSFTSPPGLKLPISGSVDVPNDSVQVIITPESVTVEKDRVLDFVQTALSAGSTAAEYRFKPQDLSSDGHQVIPVYDALIQARQKTELLLAKSKARVNGKPLEFEGVLAIQADKKVQYKTLRRIMETAGQAGYKYVRFLAMKRDT
ncbi:MAG: ExbD/TolR family protein [Bdellovibrionia bacterium]